MLLLLFLFWLQVPEVCKLCLLAEILSCKERDWIQEKVSDIVGGAEACRRRDSSIWEVFFFFFPSFFLFFFFFYLDVFVVSFCCYFSFLL